MIRAGFKQREAILRGIKPETLATCAIAHDAKAIIERDTAFDNNRVGDRAPARLYRRDNFALI